MATTPKTATLPDLALRSLAPDWNRERWEQLPADGNRYEVIDGVLYASTAPSSFHQWIIRQIVRILFAQIDDAGVGVTLWAPIGLFMLGCDPVQPDIVVVLREDLGIFHGKHIFGVAALIVEILSPSNSENDTDVKRRAYARPHAGILDRAAGDARCACVLRAGRGARRLRRQPARPRRQRTDLPDIAGARAGRRFLRRRAGHHALAAPQQAARRGGPASAIPSP
jgi:Uma2 family endonuclease